ncbi:MAG: hypothetical protein IJZ88_07335 [Clostridia bacterium]|nr:hypothetical protein [Clostridia bacterium]
MHFYEIWSVSSMIKSLEEMLPVSVNIPFVIAVVGAVFSVFAVFVCVLLFWKEMKQIADCNGIFSNIKIAEIIVYSVLFFAFALLTVISFLKTDAFYATEHIYDVIFTSDSPTLVKGNAYLTLYHTENDIRQPLFAVFSAPFTGMPYLLGKLFGASASVEAILLNIAQLIMLFAANFVVAKMLEFDAPKRICYMVVSCCTYTVLLFSMMMEQYIVAYFWLVLCVFLICESQKTSQLAFWGTGGTLLTGAVLLPFMSTRSPFKDFKKWFCETFKYGLGFIAFIFAFGRADIFLNLVEKYNRFNYFSGHSISFTDKLVMYSYFVKNCFVAPDAGADFVSAGHISWQMSQPQTFDFIGIAIFTLAIISAVLNRKKKSSLFAIGWIGFSVIMLVFLGWGTKENGLILYALYFGWAYLILVFQLFEKIEEKLKIKFITPVLSFTFCIVMLIINIPAIKEMLDFATTYYPV